jgi:hypothetical protein
MARCKCICTEKACQLFGLGEQSKQRQMLVTVLPDFKSEQLPFVTLNFKPCKNAVTDESL